MPFVFNPTGFFCYYSRLSSRHAAVHTSTPTRPTRPSPPASLPPRSVLRQRCDHFRARCDRGWADSSADRVAVPDHFSHEAVDAFLHYCYHGEVGCGVGGG